MMEFPYKKTQYCKQITKKKQKKFIYIHEIIFYKMKHLQIGLHRNLF